jgi:hypothetical protein
VGGTSAFGGDGDGLRARGCWWCGPPACRRVYAVGDVRGIQGGEGLVVRAVRSTFPVDPVGYAGPASLKLTAGGPPGRLAAVRERWARLAAIDHPGLARALEVFEGPGLFRDAPPPGADEDVLYQAAVWVEGCGLREVTPLAPRRAFALARDVGAGLAALHAHGLAHRDVHPGNVIVGPGGAAVLIDLGSARPADGADTVTVAGALGFIAPEALHGGGGPAADCWGLGMLTVFALLGHPQGRTPPDRLDGELSAALAGVPRARRALGLLRAMIDPDPDRRPDDPVAWAEELDRCLVPPRSRRPLVLATAVATVALVAAAGTLVLAGRRGDADPGPSWGRVVTDGDTPACEPVVAESGGPSVALEAAVATMAPAVCSGGEPERLVDAEVQPIADARGHDLGVVVLPPGRTPVVLTPAMWTSYQTIGPEYGGYPVRVERPRQNLVRLRLDKGLLLGHRDDTQMFWLPAPVVPRWHQQFGAVGDLGLPTSNPYVAADGRVHLDFEGGYMWASVREVAAFISGESGFQIVVPKDRAGPLGDPAPRRRIVRQATGTAWWVDVRGRRHWIPDGGTLACHGGAEAVAVDGLPGYAVATLPLGTAATCP